MDEVNKPFPVKPYRRVEVKGYRSETLQKWTTLCLCDEVSKGVADGIFFRHTMDYPCRPIRIVSWNGQVERMNSGNGSVQVNYSRRETFEKEPTNEE